MKNWIVMSLACVGMAWTSGAEVVWPMQSSIYHRSHAGVYMDTAADVIFGVWPVAWGHTAGAVYTPDGWATVKWTQARWMANVNNNFGGQDENWTLYMTGRNNGGGYSPITIEYALYVSNQAGQWFWANNGGSNYRLNHTAYYR